MNAYGVFLCLIVLQLWNLKWDICQLMSSFVPESFSTKGFVLCHCCEVPLILFLGNRWLRNVPCTHPLFHPHKKLTSCNIYDYLALNEMGSCSWKLSRRQSWCSWNYAVKSCGRRRTRRSCAVPQTGSLQLLSRLQPISLWMNVYKLSGNKCLPVTRSICET